jgi:hypothetical protein
MRAAILLGFLLLAPACVGQSPPARAQEAANELNQNGRFGRAELVAERVADGSREKFFERRRNWGGAIQIADSEVTSFKMKGDSEAEVMLKVGWYRQDEGDLHTTAVKQSWKDFKGTWKLTNEERTEGDIGLLGEPIPKIDPGVAQQISDRRAADKRRFSTIRLGQGEGEETAPSTADEQVPESPSAEPANSAKTDTSPKAGAPAKSDLQNTPQNTKAESPKAEPTPSQGAESARRPASGTP